jgi:hypothetical protein
MDRVHDRNARLTAVQLPRGMALRGLTRVLPLRKSQWFTESTGGRPAAVARWSVASPPAMPSTNVAYLRVNSGGGGGRLHQHPRETRAPSVVAE